MFFARDERWELAKLLDFGVAKARALSGSGEDHQQPIYSGALLHEPRAGPWRAAGSAQRSVVARSDRLLALTGEHPFRGENIGDLLVRICTDPLEPASSKLEGLPADIDAFFDRALCRSPDGRFASAVELADALDAIAEGGGTYVAAPIDRGRDDETIDVPRAELPAAVSAPPPAATERAPSPTPSRGWLYALGGAAVVASAWFVSQTLRGADPAPAMSAPPVTRSAPASPPSATATADSARPMASSPTPSSTATASAPQPSRVRSYIPAPRRRGPVPHTDPKFGLPAK